MKTALRSLVLPALAVAFAVPRDLSVHDDGYVSDIGEYVRSLDHAYGHAGAGEGKDFSQFDGICISYREAGVKHIHYAYQSFADPVRDIFVRAHEEMHVLKRLGHSAVLNARFRSLGIDPVVLKAADEEFIAHLAAISACVVKDFDHELARLPEGIKRIPAFAAARLLLLLARRCPATTSS